MNYAKQRGVDLSAVVKNLLLKLASASNVKTAHDIQPRKASRQLPERFKSLKGSLAETGNGILTIRV